MNNLCSLHACHLSAKALVLPPLALYQKGPVGGEHEVVVPAWIMVEGFLGLCPCVWARPSFTILCFFLMELALLVLAAGDWIDQGHSLWLLVWSSVVGQEQFLVWQP